MKSWLFQGTLAAAIALLALSSAARAQSTDNDGCSNATLRGDYAFTVQGETLGLAGTPPQYLSTYIPVNGVAMTSFDGNGNLTQVDFVMKNGIQRPGIPDPVTGFDIDETGTYTVYSDCTGTFTVDFAANNFLTVQFVLAGKGGTGQAIEIQTVVSEQHLPSGTPVGDLSCPTTPSTGCDLLVQIRSNGTKLQPGLGKSH